MSIVLDELLALANKENFTDIHLTVGTYPRGRKLNQLVALEDFGVLKPDDTIDCIKQCIPDRSLKRLEETGEVDFSFSELGLGRYRVNAFRQRGTYAMVVRVQPFVIPGFDTLQLPSSVKEVTNYPSGLVLVTGVTGSGKSTTLASLIDVINENYAKHIITVEDPIEYLHKHKKSIVNQREIGLDSNSFASALRSSLREDPDVILVGEMRDLETASIAITAAETGHLVFSTMHTLSAPQTVDRIIDIFPYEQQNQIRSQLASVLKGVITQQLIPKADQSGIVPACEIMVNNAAIGNLIRENKVYQIHNFMHTNAKDGMMTMNQNLIRLYREGTISRAMMLDKSNNKTELNNMLGGSMRWNNDSI